MNLSDTLENQLQDGKSHAWKAAELGEAKHSILCVTKTEE